MKTEEKTLFILCGEAFSGKSMLSKRIGRHYGAKIVGRDEIYFATEKILALESTPEKDDDSLWKSLWPIVTQGVKNQLIVGNSVVVDDNCLYLNQRDELRAIAKAVEARSVLIYLDIPRKVLKKRKEENKIKKERHDVPSSWLEEDTKLFERPTMAENPIIYTPDTTFNDLVSEITLLSR